ncbi:MAG: hypothetical protein E7158_06165 [Firmicutes bacterium]|nr:hypothetical protein [Bacillota bacterium]
MLNVFKDNHELNDLINDIYMNIQDVDDAYIDSFFSLKDGVEYELNYLQSLIEKIDRKKYAEVFKLNLKNALYSVSPLKVKRESESLLIGAEVEAILEEKKDYDSHFLPRFYEIKEKIIYIFQKYYESFLLYGTRRDLKEMYAIYNALIYYLISTLPETYKEELIDCCESFSYLPTELSDNSMRSAYLMKKFDISLKEYVMKKYKIKPYKEEYKHKLAI